MNPLPGIAQALDPENPVRLETRAIYRKLESILQAGGASLDGGVMINQWVHTYRGFEGDRHPADRDEVALFFEHWRSVVHPHLKGRDEYLLSERPASACMPVDRLLQRSDSVQVELVAIRDDAGLEKRSFEHDVHSPLGGYSIGIEAGGWFFTAGFTGVDFVHGIRPESRVPDFIWYGNQIYNETAETLRQLKVTVEAAGNRLEATIKALVYLTPFGMRNLAALDEAWRNYWPNDPPARAIIPVSGVGLRGTNVEIMLIVARDGLDREVVRAETAQPALGHAAQAVKAGGLLFLSSQVGLTSEGMPPTRLDDDFPALRRSAREEVRLIQDNAQKNLLRRQHVARTCGEDALVPFRLLRSRRRPASLGSSVHGRFPGRGLLRDATDHPGGSGLSPDGRLHRRRLTGAREVRVKIEGLPTPHGRSRAGTEWTHALVAYSLDRFHRKHLRTPTLRELRTGLADLPSYATIRRAYGNARAMYEYHGYLVRSRGGQPGRRFTPSRDAGGRFLPREAGSEPGSAI